MVSDSVRLPVCQAVRRQVRKSGRGGRNEQAATLRLAPAAPKHKREGHANSHDARPRAPCARTPAQVPTRTNLSQSEQSSRARALPLFAGMTGSIDHDRFRPSACVKASISDDGLVLLDVSGGLVLSSNDVGARIWQLLAARHAHSEIARHLADEYAIPLERARQDVAAFVAALIARGLVNADTRP